MDEVWSKVDGFPDYSVSSKGRVRRDTPCRGTHVGKILSTPVAPRGYKVCVLINGSTRKTFTVHRLVAAAFIDNPLGKKTVNHKDGDKGNNAVENLEWATCAEQVAHAFSTGLNKNVGELHHSAKLNRELVLRIRELSPGLSAAKIGAELGINQHCVRDVLNGRNWKSEF